MTAPANLYPGLNDISDVLEEVPLEVSRYMTLLYEIDAKCVNIIPELNACIKGFLRGAARPDADKVSLADINQWFQELIPSLEEKMHVSSIAFDSLERLTDRLELAYEVALSNQEVPEKLRLGNDNHPAMHLHRELMAKVESNAVAKSQQALKSESRREAMAAKRQPGAATAINALATTAALAASGSSAPSASAASTAAATSGAASTNASASANASAAAASAAAAHEDAGKRKRANAAAAETRRNKKRAGTASATEHAHAARPKTNEYGEALYCYCNQVAYGEMVGCDGQNCQLEWFHLPCIGLETLPRGKWYCDDCIKKA